MGKQLWGMGGCLGFISRCGHSVIMSIDGDDQPAPEEDDPNVPADVAASRIARYRSFARHMAASENASKAARLAGWSETSAAQQGWRLMQRPDVLAMVEEERQERAHRLRVTDDRIINAYATLALSDVRDVVTWNDDAATIRDSNELTEDQAMLVQSVTRKERTLKSGETIVTTEVRLADRKAAIDALARIRGLFKDKLEVETVGGIADEMEAMRRRRTERDAASLAARPVGATVTFDLPGAEPAPMRSLDAPPGRAARFMASMPRGAE